MAPTLRRAGAWQKDSGCRHLFVNESSPETRFPLCDPCVLHLRSPGLFQAFSAIYVYYDNGQGAVSAALHDALDFVLAKNVADYRSADHGARRLLQAADYICMVERALIAYDGGKQTKTQERFFGNRRSFAQSFVKQLVRKRFG